MILHSDWHIHSEASYDASLPLQQILRDAQQLGFEKVGITDHLNFNDHAFVADIRRSARDVAALQPQFPQLVLGVELTPIEKPLFDYIAKTGSRDGYEPPATDKPYDIELPMTLSQLKALGIRYAVGASHWRVDLPHARKMPLERDTIIREWYRQQMWLACDERVTILGHPWYIGEGLWYDDFSVIPASMNRDIAAAVKEHGKYVECSEGMLCDPLTSERFRHQYAEFLRELFEMGIPVTYGSDSHSVFAPDAEKAAAYLEAAGFRDGDIGEVKESDLW
ncbi:MAG: PHP domain-containing protein [Ruminococcaceae bacterium]|nr:PHP domain-containing protein [Oscillospiraceae bacterium]